MNAGFSDQYRRALKSLLTQDSLNPVRIAIRVTLLRHKPLEASTNITGHSSISGTRSARSTGEAKDHLELCQRVNRQAVLYLARH